MAVLNPVCPFCFLVKAMFFSCKDHVISPWNNPRSNPAWGLGFCNHPHRMVLTSYKVYKLVSATGLAIVLSINLRIQPLLQPIERYSGPNGAPSCPDTSVESMAGWLMQRPGEVRCRVLRMARNRLSDSSLVPRRRLDQTGPSFFFWKL